MPREDFAVLDPHDVETTLRAIEGIQDAAGWIPWFRDGHVDPWNMTEAAMALDAGGHHGAAERAYDWLASVQRDDGAWAASYVAGAAADSLLDANFSCYFAAGVWHHFAATGDDGFLARMWPNVERCVSFVLALQNVSGAISWARDAAYRPAREGLLASTSCIHLSLRCAVGVAEELREARPDWELAAARAAASVTGPAAAFEDKRQFAMDWYYPVLGGAVEGATAEARLASRWDEFVVEGRGSRCVSDRPWVTAGESAELSLSLGAVGRTDAAASVLTWLASLRDDDGMYWTGATWPEGVVWPREKTTWSAGAVVLAAAALGGAGATSRLFFDTARRAPLDTVGDPL